MKKKILGKVIDMSSTMELFEAEMERLDLMEYAQDMIDTYTNEEIAQMVREGVMTIDEVETGLRRKIA